MLLRHSATRLNFPHWQRQYEELLSETNLHRLPACATALETAIFQRTQQLRHDSSSDAEKSAIQAAMKRLRMIQEEQLGYPKWNQATKGNRP